MLFKLPQQLKKHMFDHALETPDQEVCGLLATHMTIEDQLPVSLYRIPNIAVEPATSFYMQPQSQIAALKTMREHGEHLCGIYHSHPRSEALPSEQDLQEAAYPGTAYFIISLKNDEPELGSFLFTGDAFEKIELNIIP